MNPLMTKNSKPIGFWTATSLVVGNMIGTGIYTLPASLALFGPWSLVGFVIAALGALSLAKVYAELTLAHPLSGGPYAHGEMAFGKTVGFFVAWGYWIMNWTGSAATAVGIVGYISTFVPEINSNRLLAFFIGLAIVWFFTGINCLGLKMTGRVQLFLTTLKLLPLLIFPVIAFSSIDPSHFALTSDTFSLSAINTSALLAMWSFVGLESATVPTDSISNPTKTVSRATLFGTTLTALLYLATTITLYGLLPIHTLATSSAPFAMAASTLSAAHLAPLIALCIVISGMGGLNGWILVHGQVPEAMAKDNIFPQIFAKTTASGAPIAGLLIGTLLMTSVMFLGYEEALIDQFVQIITMGGVLVLFAYFISSLAAFKLIKKRSTSLSIVCLIGAIYSLWAIYGAGLPALKGCLIAYLTGIPIYLWLHYKKG